MIWNLFALCRSSRNARRPAPGRRPFRPAVEALEDRSVPSATAPHFAVIGDYGLAGQPEQDVANLVHSWNPDFIVTVGDNNYPVGAQSTIDQNIGHYYSDYIGSSLNTNRFFPSLGDHDWMTTGATPYLNYFTLPGNERYYTFTQGPVQFFALDSSYQEPDGRSSTSKQAQWLQSQLAASTAPFKVVYFHQPPYTSSTWVANLPVMQWPFKQWGATVVLEGHAHDYERLEVGGLTYITDGLGGESTSTFGNPLPGSQVRFGTDYGALLVDANSDHLTFQFITRAGTVVDTYTLYAAPTAHPPSAPTSLRAAAASMGQVNLTWADNASNETGYKIERSTDGITYRQIATVGTDVNTYSDTGLAANTQYFYRVRATNTRGDSSYANTASDFTGALQGPSRLAATVLSATQVNLAWTDNGTTATGYKVERSRDGVIYTPIATLGASATSYRDTGLGASAQYFYRVRASSAAGNSAYTNVASTHTAIPGKPGNLTATAASARQINLAWIDYANNETGYRVERSTDGTNFTQVGTLGVGATAYTDTGLTANTRYYYQVRAYNGVGASPYSNVGNAVTLTASAQMSPVIHASANSPAQVTAIGGPGATAGHTGHNAEPQQADPLWFPGETGASPTPQAANERIDKPRSHKRDEGAGLLAGGLTKAAANSPEWWSLE